MDVYYAFNYLSAGWLCLEALPLITTPTLVVAMLSPEVREPTPLEAYLSRSLGIALVSLAILNLLLTGSVPLTSTLAETATAKGVSTNVEDPTAPYAVPSLSVTLLYHLAVAFYCHQQRTLGYSAAYALAMAVHAVFAAMGAWVLLFGASNGRITVKTGADRRVSGFPFKNEEAERRKRGGKKL